MSKHEETFSVSLSLDDVLHVCREVVAELGMSIVEQRADGLKCKEAGLTNLSRSAWTATIDIAYVGRPDGATIISLRGSNFGFGPFQSSYVRGQVGNLRNRIELMATRRQEHVAAPAGGDLAAQLQQIADLHRSGVLTDVEFQEAKARLLHARS